VQSFGWGRQWPLGVGRAMPDYRIFVFEGGHIKQPAKIISCPDDETAKEEAQKLLDGTDQPLEIWQGDRRVAEIEPANHKEATKPQDKAK
jgi:hypothetical protein